MVVMSHQYILTEEIPEIALWKRESGQKLPLMRDVDVSYYLRQEKNGFNLGPYEKHCRACWITPEDPIPEDFSFQLYPDDLGQLETYIEDAMARVPLLGQSGITKVINGLILYTPDGNPLISPMPGVRNAFEACVFTFGIAQAGGAGKVLVEWVIDGQTEWDMWSCDPRRYTDYTDRAYCIEKGLEVYGHEYAMHFPWQEWPAGHNRKRSSLHYQLELAGAVFGVDCGWERANYFACLEDDTREELARTWHRSGPWERCIREECEAVRDHCGVLAIPGFSRFKIQGPGARLYLVSLTAPQLPPRGWLGLAYFADDQGHIMTEMSVSVCDENEVHLITAEWHDLELLCRNVPDGISVTNRTKAFECVLVTGPASREILASVNNGHNLEAGWLSVSLDGRICDKECAMVRVSFAGELGWEIHCRPEDASDIWDAVTAAGAKPFGMWAFNLLCLEKGYRVWKSEISLDYILLEVGLDRFINLNKRINFPGKIAILNQQRQGITKRFVTLKVDAGDADATYISTLWFNDQVVGEVTSGGWGYRVNAFIALGILRVDLAVPGTELKVDIYGERCKAMVQPDTPLWDTQNERMWA